MISAQKNRVFTGSNYQKIQKVYSIWICPLSSTKRNSITSYDIRERQIYGRGKIPKEAYDKLNTIVITMNAEGLQSENDLIRYLSLLTINRMPVEERERELERDYHIQMNAEIKKEVKEMCNYSDRIYELGQEDARKEAEKRIQEEKRKAEKQIQEEKQKTEKAEKQIQEEKQKTEKAEKRSKEAEKAKAATERRAVQSHDHRLCRWFVGAPPGHFVIPPIGGAVTYLLVLVSPLKEALILRSDRLRSVP